MTESGGDLRVRRAPLLYQGIVRGHRFVHNPLGHDALAVLSARAARLLDAADGRTLGAIAREQGEPLEGLAAELPLLARNGFVTGDGLPEARRRAPGPRTFDAWVHVTNACNLDCPYCYIEKGAHALSDETAATLREAFVRTAREGGFARVHVRFAGGEPMLRFAFIQRFFEQTRAALRAVGAEFTAAVLTNGTVVPAGAAAWMRENGVSVSVSLDGVGAAQDAMRPARGGGGSFERVRDGLEAFLAGGVRPYVLTTVGADNLDALPELTRFLIERSLGFRFSLVRDLEGGAALLDTRGAGWNDGGLVALRRPTHAARPAVPAAVLEGAPLARVTSVLGRCYDLIEAAMPIAPSFRVTHRFCDLEIRRPISRACAAGETYVAVSDRGTVSACQAALHHEGVADLRGDVSLAEAARGLSQLGEFRRRAPNAECASCRFRHSCAGGCPLLLYRRDQNVDGRSPYCEVFRAVLPRILRIAALELLLEAEARAAHVRPVDTMR